MNTAKEIHTQLLQLMIFLRSIHPSHLNYLLKFSQHPQNINFSGEEMIQFLQRTTPDQLLGLIQLTIQKLTDEQIQNQLNRINAVLPKDGLISLKSIINLHQLELLFKTLTTSQLMIVSEILNKKSGFAHNQQILQQLQQFFSSLMPETLKGIKMELQNINVNEQLQYLQNILQLKQESWYLYDPLLKIFQMEINELMSMQNNFPKLIPLQMIHLIRLILLDPNEILEMKKIIVPYQAPVQTIVPQDDDLLDLNDLEGTDLTGDFLIGNNTSTQTNSNDNNQNMDENDDFDLDFQGNVESSVTIRIVEQPPERCVYKRNLKPNPKIILEGDDKNHPNLEVGVKLIRCDTHKEMEDKYLTGPKSFKSSVGVSIPFKKLKVHSTSHQQGETHFALKFELKEYTSETEYVILHSIQSIPFLVCSHSTQMKATNTVLPVVSQIIPPFGQAKGGTKVVVIGLNFLNTPCLRIKFDNVVVIPTFHGPKTLICVTPRHDPSIVQIKVSNDNHSFSKTDTKFTYKKENDFVAEEDKEDQHDGENQSTAIDDYDMTDFETDPHTFDSNFFSSDWNNFSFVNSNSTSKQGFNNNNFGLGEINV